MRTQESQMNPQKGTKAALPQLTCTPVEESAVDALFTALFQRYLIKPKVIKHDTMWRDVTKDKVICLTAVNHSLGSAYPLQAVYSFDVLLQVITDIREQLGLSHEAVRTGTYNKHRVNSLVARCGSSPSQASADTRWKPKERQAAKLSQQSV